MWSSEVIPRLQAVGLGGPAAARTYRLAGIGESQVAELLGDDLLRSTNPVVATYARVEAVDVRISAIADGERSADDLVDAAATIVLGHLGEYVWATGETTWADAIGTRLGDLGWTLGAVEIGTSGSLGVLLGDLPWVRFVESISLEAPVASAHSADGEPDDADGPGDEVADDLVRIAQRARELGGAEVGIAVRARPRTGDTAVSIAIVTPAGERRLRRVVFLTGPMGRSRVALTAAAALFETLREIGSAEPVS
jgi:nicotinamide-nucleotide amidase